MAVNKHNCAMSNDNPPVIAETPLLHLEKFTVWWVLWDDGIIGSYVFNHDDGQDITVNGERYSYIAFFFKQFFFILF